MTDEFSMDMFVHHAAQSLTRRYHPYVEVEDVESEIRLYLLKESKRVVKWTEAEEFFRIRRAVFGAGKRYCAKEKIARTGNLYDYDDLAWYTGAVVARLAPLAADPRFDGIVQDGESEHTGSKPDPKEGGTLLATVLDVRRGLEKFGPLPGDPDSEEYAAVCDLIAEYLGGESPETAAPRVGSRKVINNETARMVLRRQGE